MERHQVPRIVGKLRSSEAPAAWAEFLELYAPQILQIAKLFERDADRVGDCFLFVCEQLSQRRFRRLRRFRPRGEASFSTWLRVVVRNLCLDWHRREFGRERIFQSVARLSSLDQAVFRCVFLQGLSEEETLFLLQPRFPSLTGNGVGESEERLRQALSCRQLWLLEVRRPRPVQLLDAEAESNGPPPVQLADPGPDPEALAVRSQQQGALQRALARLPRADYLLLRLRFDRGLTLQQISELTGAGSPQKADRRIREIVERLRREVPP